MVTTSPPLPDSSHYFVAIDLGSNSFHMLIVRENHFAIEVVDRVKDMVQIARGLKNGVLNDAAQERALTCLARFKERLRGIPKENIKVVGTKALRAAENAKGFLNAASRELGLPIQIVSGFEEARLVYIGVAQTISHDHRKRLVIDIGGASTEFIIGQDYHPKLLESLTMGCVTFTDHYLTHDDGSLNINAKTMKRAYLSACEELEAIRRIYMSKGWDITYGASGTMKTVAELMPENTPTGVVDKTGLYWLYDTVVSEQNSHFEGIAKTRRHVLAGGIAILKAIFDQLDISQLHVSGAALKEGLIYETIGRLQHHDIRDQTVENTQQKYGIDNQQAERVRTTASELFAQINLPPNDVFNQNKILAWAAQLHEIGLSISHSGYHHHGKYILANCDLAGFNRYEQFLLSTLVGLHRRKINTAVLDSLSSGHRENILSLVICLRLAVLLNRKRDHLECQPKLRQKGDQVRLEFEPAWLDTHPLTQTSLDQETNYLSRIGIELVVN